MCVCIFCIFNFPHTSCVNCCFEKNDFHLQNGEMRDFFNPLTEPKFPNKQLKKACKQTKKHFFKFDSCLPWSLFAFARERAQRKQRVRCAQTVKRRKRVTFLFCHTLFKCSPSACVCLCEVTGARRWHTWHFWKHLAPAVAISWKKFEGKKVEQKGINKTSVKNVTFSFSLFDCCCFLYCRVCLHCIYSCFEAF